jgi:hypothetical protein
LPKGGILINGDVDVCVPIRGGEIDVPEPASDVDLRPVRLPAIHEVANGLEIEAAFEQPLNQEWRGHNQLYPLTAVGGRPFRA